jgi:small subunit ribosomal protein S20
MANTIQARKRIRQNAKNREHNAPLRSKMRSSMKRVLALIESKDKKALPEAYKCSVSDLDKNVKRGLVHKNTASRHKRIMNARIKDLMTG